MRKLLTGFLFMGVFSGWSHADLISGTSGLNGGKISGIAITAESFGASPSASAATNTTAIQNALTAAAGGEMTLLTPGTYQVNASLVLPTGGNIHVRLGANTRLLLNTGGTTVPILKSSVFNTFTSSTAISVSSISSPSSGYEFSVHWPSHNISTGTYVWISGILPTSYDGIFISTYTQDANDFVVRAVRLSTQAPTYVDSTAGYGKVADTNIFIEGGIWDCNYPVNTQDNVFGYNNQCIILGGIEKLTVKDVKINNARKYTMSVSAVRDVVIDHWSTDGSNSDGIHGFGPIFNLDIEHAAGNSLGDDVIAFNSNTSAVFINAQWDGGGDIDRVSVTHSSLSSFIVGGSGVAFYTSCNEYFGNVNVDGVDAFLPYGLAIVNVASGLPCVSSNTINSVDIRNISGNTNSSYVTFGGGTGTGLQVNNASIDHFTIDPSTGAGNAGANLVNVNTFVTMRHLTISHFVTSPMWGNVLGTNAVYILQDDGRLDDTMIEDGTLNGGPNQRMVNDTTSVNPLGVMTFKDINMLSGGGGLNQAAGNTNVFTGIVIGGNWTESGSGSLWAIRSPSNLTVIGGTFTGMTGGMARVGGNIAVNYDFFGYNLVSGSEEVTFSGTPMLQGTLCPMNGTCQTAFPAKTVVQLQALTPSTSGQSYYCSNCTALRQCISTGTVQGAFSSPIAATTACN